MASICIAGASGVVGKRFIEAAVHAGHEVRVLSHGSVITGSSTTKVTTGSGGASNGQKFRFDVQKILQGDGSAIASAVAAVEGADAVLCLSGASIGDGRMTDNRKALIVSSRVDSARALGRLVGTARVKPKRWVQMSAVGFYGSVGEHEATESDPAGNDFLAEVCKVWEAAAKDASTAAGVDQLFVARLGVVIDAAAEAWQRMLLPIKLFIGGPLGTGKQWMSWIDGRDAAGALLFLATQAQTPGVYNVTAPLPVRQSELVSVAAKRLNRPSLLPTPSFALRLALGEMADLLVLSSCRAASGKLEAAGYVFEARDIHSCVERQI